MMKNSIKVFISIIFLLLFSLGANALIDVNIIVPSNEQILNTTILPYNLSLQYSYNGTWPTSGGWCYQESTNVSNQGGLDGSCGLNYTGNYSWSGSWGNPTNTYDGDWSTYSHTSNCGYNSYLYSNYRAPSNVSSALVQFKYQQSDFSGLTYLNYTLPSQCLNSIVQLRLREWETECNCDYYAPYMIELACYGTSSWVQVFYNESKTCNTGQLLFEEAIWWNITPTSNSFSKYIINVSSLPNLIETTSNISTALLNAPGVYTVNITVNDTSNNKFSSQSTFNLTLYTVNINIISPTNAQVFSGYTPYNLSVLYTAIPSNVVIDKCFVNGALINGCANTTILVNSYGQSTINITVNDTDGNLYSDQHIYTLAQPPTIALVSPNKSSYANKTLPVAIPLLFTLINYTGISKCYIPAEICYQETATVATACGGLSTGIYNTTGNWISTGTALYDGNWNSGAKRVSGTPVFYVNYTKPVRALNSSMWTVKDEITPSSGVFDVYRNFTLPQQCWNAYPDKIALSFDAANTGTRYYCYNGASWVDLSGLLPHYSTERNIFEEAMIWVYQAYTEFGTCSNTTFNAYRYGLGNVSVIVEDLAGGVAASFIGEYSVSNISSNISSTPNFTVTDVSYKVDYNIGGDNTQCGIIDNSPSMSCSIGNSVSPIYIDCSILPTINENIQLYASCNDSYGNTVNESISNLYVNSIYPNVSIEQPINQSTIRGLNVSLGYTVYNSTPIGSCLIDFNGDNNNSCYQETANISTSCGGLSTGKYSNNTEWWYDLLALYDGNWNTGTQAYTGPPYPTPYFYINYSKPVNAQSDSKWVVKNNVVTELTIPAGCWDASISTLFLRIWSHVDVVYNSNTGYECYNGTSWVPLFYVDGYNRVIMEEAMDWKFTKTLQNCENTTVLFNTYGLKDIRVYPSNDLGLYGQPAETQFSLFGLTSNISSYYAVRRTINVSLLIDSGNSDIYNCTIVSNSSSFSCENKLMVSGESNSVICTSSDSTEEIVSVYPQCINAESVLFNGLVSQIFIDSLPPEFVNPVFDQNGIIVSGRDNITGQFTILDSNLYEVNTTINGVQIDDVVNINSTNYTYILNKNLNHQFRPGNYTLMIQAWDSHTAESINDYDVSKPLFSNTITYTTDTDNVIAIKANDEGNTIFNPFSTRKQNDRYTFDYRPSDSNADSYTFLVTSEAPLYIVDKPNLKYKKWLVSGKNWVDFYTPSIGTTVDITQIDEYTAQVVVTKEQSDRTSVVAFSSIGDLNEANVTYSLYIGAELNVSAYNSFNSVYYPVNGFNATVTRLTGGNVPGEFTGTINFVGNNGLIENLTNSSYRIVFDSPYLLPKTYILNINNATQYLNYTSNEAELNIVVRNVQDLVPLTGIDVTVSNTGYNTTINSTGFNVFLLNASAYAYSIFIPKYGIFEPYTRNITLNYKDNITVYADLPFIMNYEFLDEKTQQPFNMSSPTAMDLQVNCQDLVYLVHIKNSSMGNYTAPTNFSTLINCTFKSYMFQLYFDDLVPQQNYFRTFVYIYGQSLVDQKIYLIDIRNTNYVINNLIIDDLLNLYQQPSIFVYRWLGNQYTLITSGYVDIERKIEAYLVQNAEYTIELHSTNQPVQVLGDYMAVANGDKVLKLYQVQIGPLPPKGQTYYGGQTEIDNVSYAYFTLNSSDISTSTIHLIANRSATDDGIEIDTYTTSDSNFMYKSSIEGMNSSGLMIKADLNNDLGAFSVTYPVQTAQVQQVTLGPVMGYFNWTTKTVNGKQTPVLGNALQWGFLLLIAFIALAATIDTANIVSLILIAMGAFFSAMHLLPVAMGSMGLALLVAIINMLREGSKRQ
jgi:hypothetical protein